MKKVLAWAVALALVLSSFTMAFAGQAKTSADFSDASQINYTEAVDVMVATGIINGYPDGTFGPAKTVKRSEMAKMIACIKNGGEDVGDQYKSACPFADSKDHWAAGYIAYCASEHIIDGRSADVFDPEAQVTGTEVAKMALTSLGYDSKIQGYTGETWAAAVLKDAKKVGLFKGLDSSFVPGDPCPREAAAQILFNMLKATEVEYKNGTSVSIGDDISVVVDSDIQPVVPDDEAFGDTLEMYEDVFGGKLVASDEDDASGRPAHEWTYAGDDVGTYTNSAVLEFTANDSDTFNKALKEEDSATWDTFFGKKAENEVTSLFLNGLNLTEESEESAGTADEDAPAPAEMPVISLGDKVELFDMGNNAYRVVVTKYYPALITKVNTDLDEEAAEEHDAQITLTVGRTEIPVYDDQIPNYDASTYVEDAVIAIAPNYEETTSAEIVFLDSYLPEELVKGAVSKIKNNTVTINGTAYEKTTAYTALDGQEFAVGDTEYTVYDYNGYAFASIKDKAADPEVFYGVITSTKHVAGTDAEWEGEEGTPAEDWVRILTPAGETEEYELALATGASAPAIGELISYELEDGKISKTAPATSAPDSWTGQPVKTGDVLYGKQLAGDVAAFALIPASGEEKAKWVVYDMDDLKAATAITVKEYFPNEDGVSIMKVESLEEATADTVVLAFVTKATVVQNSTGDAYDIEAFVNGKAEPFTTVGNKDEKTQAAYDALKTTIEANMTTTDNKVYVVESGAALVKFTMDGELVKSVEVASCYGVDTPGKDFPVKEGTTKYDAVFYLNNGESIYATDGIRPVISVSGNSLNVGSADFIDNQTVTNNAAVYYVGSDGMTASEFSKIKKDNKVILMQLDEESSTWDTVIYTD